jgi:zinc protease
MWMRPERLVVSVSGPISRGHLDSWLKELDQRVLSITGKAQASVPTTLSDEPVLKAPRWIEKSLNREQVHILVGGLGTKVNADDRHPIRLMNTILGGQSGRLFIELREKKSLAYTVSPLSMEGIEKGYVGTYIASAPAKRDEAIAGIKKVLETLAEKGPTSVEMNRAKEFFLGRRAMDLQSDSSLAAHYGLEALYGLEDMTESAITKRIRAISAKEIQAVCRKYLIEPHMVTSIVG